MIGIFDSGIGGLTVAREITRLLPQSDILYFGDTARTPYGTKSPVTVISYSLENTEFLIQKRAKVILVACNTASSVATGALRSTFDTPVFEVITPAVEMALGRKKSRGIGVIGTRATIGSGAYEKKIREMAKGPVKVHARACPLLVPLVEEGWLNRPETRSIVKKYLLPLKTRQIDTLILGCTHYPVLKEVIQAKIGKRVRVVDSSLAMAASLDQYVREHPGLLEDMGHSGQFDLYVSDVTPQFEKTAHMILKKKVNFHTTRR